MNFTEQSRAQHSRAEQSRAETNRTKQNRTEQNKRETNRTEQNLLFHMCNFHISKLEANKDLIFTKPYKDHWDPKKRPRYGMLKECRNHPSSKCAIRVK